jgi:zinc protease
MESTNMDKFVLLPVKDDPTISFKIWFKVGSQNDPVGKEGLAHLTAQMIADAGTKKNTYEQILEKLYPLAVGYSVTVDKEMTVIEGRTHKDNLNEFYTLLREAITEPAFSADDFARLKSRTLNYLENELRYSSDEELGKAVFYQFVFDGTSYRHLTEGTVAALNSITVEDVKAFYTQYFNRNNYVIGLAGNYPEDFPAKVDNELSVLSDNKIMEMAKPVPPPIIGKEIILVDKDCDATAISFGFPVNLLRGDKDFFALFLFNSWFGEHRNQSSHLYQVIREKRGMNYGDYSYVEHFANGGGLNFPEPNYARRQQLFEVWLRPVQHQLRHFALRAAVRELQKVVENGLTQDDFEITKNFLYNYSLFYAQTTSDRLGYQIDSKFYGIQDDGNYIDLFRSKIKNLTLADVNAAIKKYIQFDNLKIAIITQKAEDFKSDLTSDKISTVSYITPMSEAVLSEDKIIEVYKLNIKPERITVVKVEEVFSK